MRYLLFLFLFAGLGLQQLNAQSKVLFKQQLTQLLQAYPNKFRNIEQYALYYNFYLTGAGQAMKQLRNDTFTVSMVVMLESTETEAEANEYFKKWATLLNETDLKGMKLVAAGCNNTDTIDTDIRVAKCTTWKLDNRKGTVEKKYRNFSVDLTMMKINKSFCLSISIGDGESAGRNDKQETASNNKKSTATLGKSKTTSGVKSFRWKEAGISISFNQPVSVTENSLVSNNDLIEIKWPGGDFSYMPFGLFLTDKSVTPTEYVQKKMKTNSAIQEASPGLSLTHPSNGISLYAEEAKGNYANKDFWRLCFAFNTPTGKLITGDFISHKKEKVEDTFKAIRIILSDIYLNMVR